MKRAIVVASLFFAVGCGDEGLFGGKSDGGSSNEPQHSLYVTDASSLPACDAAAEGWLAFLAAESKLQACIAGTWTDVEVKTKENKIVATIHCEGVLSGSLGITAFYNAALMSSGDVFASASVASGEIQASGAEFYSAKQVGAATGPVRVQFDLQGTANYGYFDISLDRTTMIVTVSYVDPDGDFAWTTVPENCVRTDS